MSAADGPFATLARAQVAVRALAAQPQHIQAIIVKLVDGRYALTAPGQLTESDSGSADTPMMYPAATGAKPIISGGQQLVGRQVGVDGRWTTTVPDVAKGFYPRQLTINGERRYRPRLSKSSWYVINGFAEADPQAKYNTPADRFEFKTGDLNAQWKIITDIE